MIRILLSTRLGERKWTQADLVRETGIRASTINDLYHEMTDRVSLEQLDQICKALDCDINEILVREEKIDERTRQRMGPAPERRKSITASREPYPGRPLFYQSKAEKTRGKQNEVHRYQPEIHR